MKFSVCLVLLVTMWQASAQAPGDEDSHCVNQRGPYPPDTRMLMDSRNYEQLLTGSGAVWQALNVDGAGSGVGGRHNNWLFYIHTGIYLHVNWLWDRRIELFVTTLNCQPQTEHSPVQNNQ